MRDLVSRAALGSPGRQKVYIVDEVHMLSTAASNALLKTLEEPPAHVIFVLATTDPQKVLPTIRSRTQHFEFRLLGPDTLSELLAQVRTEAHLDVGDDALDLAVRRGRGSARDALSILDQVAASDSAADDDLPELDEMVEALAERDVERALVAVAHLTAAGFSPQQLTVDLVDHLRQGFLALVAPDLVMVAGAERDVLAAQAGRVGLATLVRAMEDLGRAQVQMRDAPDPRVNLEVALVRLVHPEADDSPAALLARIERLEAAGVRSPDLAPAAAPTTASVATPSPPTSTSATGAALAARAAAVPTGRPAQSAESEKPPPAVAVNDEPLPAGPTGSRPTLGAVRRRSGSVPSEPREHTPTTELEVAVERVSPPTAPSDPVAHPSEVSPSTVPASSVPLPSLEELVRVWGDHMIGRLRPKAKALFQAGRFVAADADGALFALPNEIHRTRCTAMRHEVEAALADQFGRPIPLVLVVDGASTPWPVAERNPSDGSTGSPESTVAAGAAHDDEVEDLADFDADNLEVVEVDNSAEARLLQAFPGAEEVV
jgi:DNA polymerase-3 subunit gamma/tau